MPTSGRGSHLDSQAKVQPSPIPWTVLGIVVLCLAAPVRADNLFNRWRIFTPASAQKVSTTPHPAVVRVIVDEGRILANGTGSFLAARDQYGLVVTNWHVVRDAKGPIQVVFPDGFKSEATLLRTDQDWDLAALLIWRPNVTELSIGTTAPQPGDELTIAGYGQGDYRAVVGKCTQYLSPSMKHPYEILEVSAAARQGDSGGPILNDRGELVGVLFGADRATTSGSYCGRVRWFLSSVWPELDVVKKDRPTTTPLVGFPTPGFPTPASPIAGDETPPPPQTLVPIVPQTDSAAIDANASSQSLAEVDPIADATLSTPYTTLPPLPDPPAKSLWGGNDLLGTTRFDQAKTILAILGLLALWGHISRWLSN